MNKTLTKIYNKTEADSLLSTKYSKTEVDNLLSTKISKGGDIITGSSFIIQNGSPTVITKKTTEISFDQTPANDRWPLEIGVKLNDDYYLGYLAWIYNMDQVSKARLLTRYKSASAQNYLELTVDKNNNAKVNINHPEAWCEALKIGTINCTSASGVTSTNFQFYYWGRLGYVLFQNVKISSAGSGWTTIGTLPSGYSAIAYSYGQIFDDDNSVSGYPPMVESRIAGSNIQIYKPLANTSYWGGYAFVLAL